jgi:hypothetical protein
VVGFQYVTLHPAGVLLGSVAREKLGGEMDDYALLHAADD